MTMRRLLTTEVARPYEFLTEAYGLMKRLEVLQQALRSDGVCILRNYICELTPGILILISGRIIIFAIHGEFQGCSVDVNIILCIQPLELCLVEDSRRRDKGFNGPIDLYSAAFLFISPAFGFSFLRCSIFRVYQVTH